ncbi:HNH endonuclease [Paraclostridium sordellii]|uniref:HNH endonuclease n=1 Tax=Paraclostridium sordellii TaxID=1505 RepID=UPI0005DB44C0|nr:HNH endonuclease signature motif containing protein [Paeniclostridium sordellii]CEN87035.1 HNH endonuclease [[Clostridium] sordellii] [Paeniclostridium sordellii]
MSNKLNLKQGDILINDELMEIFKCSGQGGMRKSNKTNTLVLISDETKGLYEDKWYGDEFHYTGMGKKGDQSLDFMQNKTLAQSSINGVEIHLFEVFEKKKYTYVGQVKLNGEPYQAIQKDEDGLDRNVWIFKLRLIDEYEIPKIRQEIINQNTKQKERKAKKLSNEDLKEKAKEVKGKPGTRNTVSETYNRNAYVVEHTRRRANGICELCGNEAPFKNSKGEPYLEVHHIVWLSKGGDDTIENTAALCPNCHRKMHIINDGEDVEYLKNKIY